MQPPAPTGEQPAEPTQTETPPEAPKEPETANQVFDRVVGSVLDKHNAAHAAPAAAVQDEAPAKPEEPPAPAPQAGQSPAQEQPKTPAEEMPVDNLTLIKKEIHTSSLDDSLKKDIEEEFQNIISGKKKKLKNQKLKELLVHIQYYKAHGEQMKSDPDVNDLMNSPDQIDWDSLTNH
jgi:membrane carboxypeptidase/penicillin-binding protein PbpC